MSLLGIFAKHWTPGAVKTRLAAAVGSQLAAAFHRACVESLLIRLADVADQRVLAVTPPGSVPEFRRIAGPAWRVIAQADGDLGTRMADFFTAAFRDGSHQVVLIGSDSPSLPRAYLARAFELLPDYPVVLGPADDGGYYLVGAAGRVPPMFTGIAWSTAAVFSQTVDRLEQAGWPFAVLPGWYDVDEVPSLLRLRQELEQDPALDLPGRRLLEIVRQTVSNQG